MSCETRQQRLEELVFEGDLERLAVEEREHLAGCADCGAHHALLLALNTEAERATAEPLPPQLLAAVERRAVRVLRAAQPQPHPRLDGNLVAPLAVALLALPIAVGQGWLWMHGLSFFLAEWIPASILTGIFVFYVVSVALPLGALYGSLPLAVAYANRTRMEAA